MASGDGKSNPFGSGSSGAVGNGSAGSAGPGFDTSKQCGPNRPQKSGPNSDLAAHSIPEGGKVLKLDPKSDRQGLVGQTAAGGMKHKPYKLGGPSMAGSNADVEDAAPVGDVDMSDGPDMG